MYCNSFDHLISLDKFDNPTPVYMQETIIRLMLPTQGITDSITIQNSLPPTVIISDTRIRRKAI